MTSHMLFHICRLCDCFRIFRVERRKFILFKLLKCLIEFSLSVKMSIDDEIGVTMRAVSIAIVSAREDEGHFSTDEVKVTDGVSFEINAKPKVILQDSFFRSISDPSV